MDKRLTVTFEDEAYAELERLEEKMKVSRAWLVRRAWDEYLERIRKDRE